MSQDSPLIITDNRFDARECSVLSTLARIIIPASEQYGLPGADDEAIFSILLHKGVRWEPQLKRGVRDFVQFAKDCKLELSALNDDDLASLVDEFEELHPDFVQTMMTLTAQSYYMDERVLNALELPTGPPFPDGHEVQPGDWTLLEPVKQREKFYREIR